MAYMSLIIYCFFFFFEFIDPQQWTPDQVQSWLHTTITQFELPAVENIEQLFPEDGAALSLLTDDEFIKRIPQVIKYT